MGKQQNKIILELVVESAGEGDLQARVTYDDNLIVVEEKDLSDVQKKAREVLHDFHALDPERIDFQITYDITALFDDFDVLKPTKIAALAGINESQMRQYATGAKNPGKATAKKIEDAIHELAKKLEAIHIHA